MTFFAILEPLVLKFENLTNGNIRTSNNKELTLEEFNKQFKIFRFEGKNFAYKQTMPIIKCASMTEGVEEGNFKCNMLQNPNQTMFQPNEILQKGSEKFNFFDSYFIKGEKIKDLERNYLNFLKNEARHLSNPPTLTIEAGTILNEVKHSQETFQSIEMKEINESKVEEDNDFGLQQ